MNIFKKALITFLLISFNGFSQINIYYPSTRIVIQRSNANKATVFVSGKANQSLDRIDVRVEPRPGEGGVYQDWQPIAYNISDYFSGSIPNVVGGRYDLSFRAIVAGNVVGSVTVVERVGVGEVFLIVGHSNAAGGFSPSVGAISDRVSTINWVNTDANWFNYWNTANPASLPGLQFSQLCTNCGMAPAAGIPWFWGQLGDLIVNNLQVPVLFYSAAFGGSNMVATYKAAYDVPFSHSFINYSLRFPYVNIRNAFSKYIPYTGIRAILSAHGINDREEPYLPTNDPNNPDFRYAYERVIDKTRNEINKPDLAWMVATAGWIGSVWLINGQPVIQDAQNAIIANKPHVFRGANLDAIDNTGRGDGVHFNEAGQTQAAQKWLEAILTQGQPSGTPNFLTSSNPLLVTEPPVYFAKTITSGNWNDAAVWSSGRPPTWTADVEVSPGHTVTIPDNYKAQIKSLNLKGTLLANLLIGISFYP
jgi:hypothetical protein